MSQRTEHGWLDVERRGGVTLARILCRRLCYEEEVQELGKQLFALLEQGGGRRLVVSLAGAEDVGTALFGRLIALHKKAAALGGRLALCRLPPPLRQALEAAQLSRFFHIYGTEQEAVLSF
jgi:anti-sigma B factor antagonist